LDAGDFVEAGLEMLVLTVKNPWVFVCVILLIIGISWVYIETSADCSNQTCSQGNSRLIDGECLCVSDPMKD
jgi:hypothetical protein